MWLFQRITAADYDAAVRRDPASCPYFAMGDLRSGRQVLKCLRVGGLRGKKAGYLYCR